MGEPAVGDVVVVSFPFSDGSGSKKRPAAVVAIADDRDVVMCQITSRPYSSKRPVTLARPDFAHGSLPVDSYIRPEKLFTASAQSIDTVATIKPEVVAVTRETIRALFA